MSKLALPKQFANYVVPEIPVVAIIGKGGRDEQKRLIDHGDHFTVTVRHGYEQYAQQIESTIGLTPEKIEGCYLAFPDALEKSLVVDGYLRWNSASRFVGKCDGEIYTPISGGSSPCAYNNDLGKCNDSCVLNASFLFFHEAFFKATRLYAAFEWKIKSKSDLFNIFALFKQLEARRDSAQMNNDYTFDLARIKFTLSRYKKTTEVTYKDQSTGKNKNALKGLFFVRVSAVFDEPSFNSMVNPALAARQTVSPQLPALNVTDADHQVLPVIEPVIAQGQVDYVIDDAYVDSDVVEGEIKEPIVVEEETRNAAQSDWYLVFEKYTDKDYNAYRSLSPDWYNRLEAYIKRKFAGILKLYPMDTSVQVTLRAFESGIPADESSASIAVDNWLKSWQNGDLIKTTFGKT